MKGHEAGNQPDDRDLAASSISQLIIFNSKFRECPNKKVQHIRHNTKNETPIAIYNGLKLQVKTRKRQLIDLQNKCFGSACIEVRLSSRYYMGTEPESPS